MFDDNHRRQYDPPMPRIARIIAPGVPPNLTPDPHAWNWSSAKAHADGTDDLLVKVSPLLQIVGDWKQFLKDTDEEDANKKNTRPWAYVPRVRH